MARKTRKREFTDEQRVEFLLAYAMEMEQRSFTLADAGKLLADCGGDTELAEFELTVRGMGHEGAIERFPELIYKYPSLYQMSPEESAEYDRRLDAAFGL